MQFHLNYTPPLLPSKIDHGQGILMMGSCFSESMGTYLQNYKFRTLVNPNGILFNPASIATALSSYITGTAIDPKATVQHKDLFCNLQYHGDYTYRTKNELDSAISASISSAHSFLKEADWLIITFGSAHVYRHLNTNSIAANCHKLPQSEFRKERLVVKEITSQYTQLIDELRKFNPSLKFIFTVSPVKYLRDGVTENSLSKAILIQSAHELVNSTNDCFYFPAYELMNDDLRDYRFYKEDLAHPNESAINYIWEKFSESAFSEETQSLNKKINDILQAAWHRPVHADSDEHLKFKKTFFQKSEALENQFPFLNFETEKKSFI